MSSTETNTDVIVRILLDYFKNTVGRKPEILAIYLFGSLAKKKLRNSSDIDIAFLFEQLFYKNNPYKSFSTAQIMGAEVGKAVSKKLDVALLNGSSLFFAYEVISTGICLYEKDSIERIRYEIAIKGQYFDFKPFITQLRQNKIAQMCTAAEGHVR